MNIRSLRYRLVAWYAMWLAVVFTAAGALLYIGLRHYQETTLGTTQRKRAERIALLFRGRSTVSPASLTDAITAVFAPEASGRFVRVAKSDGNILYQSGPPVDQSFDPAQISAPPRQAGIRREMQVDASELVIATLVTKDGIIVETGESLTPALAELRRLMVLLVLTFLLLTIVALGGSVILLRRALRPVDKIIRSAEHITSHSLSDRLPVPPSGDEFEHLSQTLNRMIARLDDSFQLNRRFLADASHELRTPLTILRSELEAMVQRPQLESDARAVAGDLLDEVERLAAIVENLFALSRLDAGYSRSEHARCDLASLVATTSEQMCLLAEDKGLTMSCATPAPVFVEGDRARLKQVIVNLLDNAIKYTPPGGSIKLTVDARGGEARFEVEDTGVGIPAEAQPHVFERFFRVDAARSRQVGGAGIGLSLVKAICQAHHGRVEVASQVDQGSRFTVYLPLAG